VKFRLHFLAVGLFLLPTAASTASRTTTVQIAAASDLVFCLEALHAEFQRQSPEVDLKLSVGSSGNFFAQIRHGAPFDVFLSADLDYPRALITAGEADAASLTPYAIGRIVLWTLRDDLDLSRGLSVLRDPRIRRIAIAQPAHAPYGRAAQEALQAAEVFDEVRARLVMGENIAQTAQFVQTRNAEVGIVALSLVLAPRLRGVGHYAEIPAAMHQPLEQGAVLTRRGATNPAATRYLEFLRSSEARQIFGDFGFVLPPPKPAGDATAPAAR
jgi:molybdate transport system substrate-binding protein